MRRLFLALFAASLPVIAVAQPIEGIYVSGGGGLAFLENQRILSQTVGGVTIPSIPSISTNFKTGYTGMLSLGYGFGNGVRLEIEGNFQDNNRSRSGDSPRIVSQSGGEEKYGALANVLFDMDIGSPYIFPYLGAGAGYENVQRTITKNYPNAVTNIDQGQAAFAYQAIAGLGFPIPGVVGLSATLEYRFFALTGRRSYIGSETTPAGNVAYGFRTSDDNNHLVLVGFRYAFNVPTPEMPAAPAPIQAASPAPVPTHSYLVFFDWDSAELSARAQQVIGDAANASRAAKSTRINVAGHADRTGTEAYNQALSLKRANVVAAELVRLGVAKSEIAISAFGDTKPLVPTQAGVREPQNRRVEIVLN